MDLINRLKIAILTAQQEDDLPDFLAERIFVIADSLSNNTTLRSEIEELIEQLTLYDTYGQTGYIGMGVSSTILEGTIGRLEGKLQEIHKTAKE